MLNYQTENVQTRKLLPTKFSPNSLFPFFTCKTYVLSLFEDQNEKKKMEMRIISTSKNGEDPFLIHEEEKFSPQMRTEETDVVSLVESFQQMSLETDSVEKLTSSMEKLELTGNFDFKEVPPPNISLCFWDNQLLVDSEDESGSTLSEPDSPKKEIKPGSTISEPGTEKKKTRNTTCILFHFHLINLLTIFLGHKVVMC